MTPALPVPSPEAQAVLDAAVNLFGEHSGQLDQFGISGEQFRDAVRAYTTPVPSPVLPPEPEPGPYLTNAGTTCEIGYFGSVYFPGEEYVHSWAEASAKFAPFTRLRPVSEVVDRADARELAKTVNRLAHALRLMLSAAGDGTLPLPSTMHQARTALAQVAAALAVPVPAGDTQLRVIVVLDRVRGRVHSITTDDAVAQQHVRELAAKHGGAPDSATMTVGLVDLSPSVPAGDTSHDETGVA